VIVVTQTTGGAEFNENKILSLNTHFIMK